MLAVMDENVCGSYNATMTIIPTSNRNFVSLWHAFRAARGRSWGIHLATVMLAMACVMAFVLAGCASTGKHVKDTIDNVHEYALFGDEYSRW